MTLKMPREVFFRAGVLLFCVYLIMQSFVFTETIIYSYLLLALIMGGIVIFPREEGRIFLICTAPVQILLYIFLACTRVRTLILGFYTNQGSISSGFLFGVLHLIVHILITYFFAALFMFLRWETFPWGIQAQKLDKWKCTILTLAAVTLPLLPFAEATHLANFLQSGTVIETERFSIGKIYFTADSTRAVIMENNEVIFLDPETGKSQDNETISFERIGISAAFSPDGRYLAFGGISKSEYKKNYGIVDGSSENIEDCFFDVWDLKTNKLIVLQRSIKIPPDISRITAVAFSPDGRYLASHFEPLLGKGLSYIEIWDTKTWQLVKSSSADLLSFSLSEPLFKYSPDGKYLLAETYMEKGSGSRACLWDIENEKIIKFFSFPESKAMISMSDAEFSPDGKYLAVTTSAFQNAYYIGGYLHIWEIDTGDFIHRQNITERNKITYSPDGQYLVMGGKDQKIHVLDVKTWEEVETMTFVDISVEDIKYSPNGRYLAVKGFQRAKIWDMAE